MGDQEKDSEMNVAEKKPLSYRLKKSMNKHLFRGVIAIVCFFVIWEILVKLQVPIIKNIPPVEEVIGGLFGVIILPKYWASWPASFFRILTGFAIAQIVGVPLGLAMAVNRYFKDTTFPIIEMLRPIPPVGWIPIAIIFCPTREMSVIFVAFLGAFWIVIVNVLGGAANIDIRIKRAAFSLGASPRYVFWKVILPATLPSIFTGMVVGMGITWETVVAAEMIAGRGGLGYMLWEFYLAYKLGALIVCMISIGIAGYISSALVRFLGDKLMPWRKLF